MSTGDRVREILVTLAQALSEETDVSDLRPLLDRVLVVPIKEEGIAKKGSLYLPAEGRNAKYEQAYVVAIGLGGWDKRGQRVPIDVNPGDVVVVGAYTGQPMDIGDVEHRWVKAADILAVVA